MVLSNHAPISQSCIKRLELRSEDGLILPLFSIVLVVVLVLVLDFPPVSFEEEVEDEDEDD